MNMLVVQSAAAQKLQVQVEDDPFFQRKFQELQGKVTVILINPDDMKLDDWLGVELYLIAEIVVEITDRIFKLWV